MSEFVKQFSQKSVVVVLIIIATYALFGCGGAIVSSNWVGERIKVDGKIDDWTELSTVYFEDEALSLGLANDSTMLYLMVRTRNEDFVRTVHRSGLRIKLKPKTSEGRTFDLVYRGGTFIAPSDVDMREEMKHHGMNGQNDFDGKEHFTIKIKNRLSEMEILPDGSNGPSVHTDTSMTFYVYEFAIPLSETVVRYYGLNVPAGSKIEVTAAWGGTNHEITRLDPSFDSGPKGGGGGIPGIGSGGIGSGGRGDQRSPEKRRQMQTHQVRFDIQLATAVSENN